MYFPFSWIHFVSGEGLFQNTADEIKPVKKLLHLGPFITEKNFYFNGSKGFQKELLFQRIYRIPLL